MSLASFERVLRLYRSFTRLQTSGHRARCANVVKSGQTDHCKFCRAQNGFSFKKGFFFKSRREVRETRFVETQRLHEIGFVDEIGRFRGKYIITRCISTKGISVKGRGLISPQFNGVIHVGVCIERQARTGNQSLFQRIGCVISFVFLNSQFADLVLQARSSVSFA